MQQERTNIFRLLFALVIVCGLFTGCENDQEDIDVWTGNKVMVEEATMMESYLSQNGLIKAKLTAPLMLRVIADTLYMEFPKSLHCDFYNDSSVVETTVDSRYGKYFESLNKVYLRDSVVVISMRGDTLWTPDLWWDQNLGLFYTDKYTRYHTRTDQYYGMKGMEATQDLKRVTFNEGGGSVQMSGSGFPEQ